MGLYQDAFERIERAVEEGSDLRGLGFWPLVREIKADPRLAEHWADTVGRIDRMAFERRTRFRLPVWTGNAILSTLSVVWLALVPVGLALARGGQQTLGGLLVLGAGVGLGVAIHGPAHWLVGNANRIRFHGYFLKKPLFTPCLKIDYASYLRAEPAGRATMHAAGAIATKAAPFAVFTVAYLRHRAEGYALLPSWSLWALLGVGVLQIVTDVVWSRKYSDWKKVLRERAVAAAIEAGRGPGGRLR